MRKISDVELEELESLIDSIGLSQVVGALADICYMKEQHVAENWQDEALAKDWHKAGAVLSKAAYASVVTRLP